MTPPTLPPQVHVPIGSGYSSDLVDRSWYKPKTYSSPIGPAIPQSNHSHYRHYTMSLPPPSKRRRPSTPPRYLSEKRSSSRPRTRDDMAYSKDRRKEPGAAYAYGAGYQYAPELYPSEGDYRRVQRRTPQSDPVSNTVSTSFNTNPLAGRDQTQDVFAFDLARQRESNAWSSRTRTRTARRDSASKPSLAPNHRRSTMPDSVPVPVLSYIPPPVQAYRNNYSVPRYDYASNPGMEQNVDPRSWYRPSPPVKPNVGVNVPAGKRSRRSSVPFPSSGQAQMIPVGKATGKGKTRARSASVGVGRSKPRTRVGSVRGLYSLLRKKLFRC